MDALFLMAITLLGSILGGALGAYASKAVMWKGAVTALLAALVQYAVGWAAEIETPIYDSLIFLVATGLIGGKWGLKLSVRQLMHVVIGSFLLTIALVMIYIHGFLGLPIS